MLETSSEKLRISLTGFGYNFKSFFASKSFVPSEIVPVKGVVKFNVAESCK